MYYKRQQETKNKIIMNGKERGRHTSPNQIIEMRQKTVGMRKESRDRDFQDMFWSGAGCPPSAVSVLVRPNENPP